MKTITLSPNEIQIVIACLAKQPYEVVAAVIAKITQQMKEQEQQMHEPGEPVVP